MSKNTKSWKPTVQSLRADWFDLPTELRFPLVGVTVAELTAKIAMWVSLSRRPAEKVRGPKWLWVLGSFINGIGPAAYWTFGRK